MDKQELMLKICGLLPSSLSSCQFRNVCDVAESSIPITKLENHDHSSVSSLSLPETCNNTLLSHRPPTKTDDKLRQKRAAISLINHSSTSNGGCFTSSDDDDTFFSLSSNSCDSFSRRFRRRDHTYTMVKSIDDHQISTELYYRSNGGRRNRRRMKKGGGAVPAIGDSYAVEKRSRDPQGDFRASMVEMIVEKRIFAAEDLERLLRAFLSLNSPSYHGIIFHVFSEICQILFTN
ncbi:ovate family protein 8 [Perilla frutescens var. frutescens]|nr:ovate family protein 8 [Perilla frutescens var. frutescens]